MSSYAKIENNQIVEYPLGSGDIRLRFPNSSLPNPFVPPQGYVEVVSVEPPVVEHTKNFVESTPVLINNVWTQKFDVVDATNEEITERTLMRENLIRRGRDNLLLETDWTQGKDIPDSISSKYVTYRQQLRDVPAQEGFPWNVTWPTKPE